MEKITKEEVDKFLEPEEVEAAEALAEEIYGHPVAQLKQKKGRKRKAAIINKDFDDAVQEMIGEKDKIAPAQDPMDVKMPDAVINACTKRMEELETKMQEINAKIDDLKSINKSCEGEYKVLADFILKKGK